MTPAERRATAGLALIYALRMVGMFMVLPVIAIYAHGLPVPATALQIGLVMGLYGLAQAVLQIPLGMLSDRIGRKPVIVAGLLLFAVGSFIAGATHDIRWILLGRFVQGLGAVSSAVSALLADLTRDSVRTTAMAILGAGMGLSFIAALVAGPIVAGHIGVDGIFTLTGGLALLGIPIVLWFVPRAPPIRASNRGALSVLRDGQLLRLDGGILILHALLTTLFAAVPFAVEATLGLPAPEHWKLYLPVLLVSVLPVFPLIRWAEHRRPGAAKGLFLGAVVTLSLSMALLAEGHARPLLLVAAVLLFFVAFNYLEGTLPSLISRRAPVQHRGAALGVYSSAQFVGPMLGGGLGALAQGQWGLGGTFALAALLPLLWLSFAVRLELPVSRRVASGAEA